MAANSDYNNDQVQKWRIVLARSAYKHGYERFDAYAAISRARLAADPFEASRVSSQPDPAGWIGPAIDGSEIEVFAEVDHNAREIWVFHIMEARAHVIRRIQQAQQAGKQ